VGVRSDYPFIWHYDLTPVISQEFDQVSRVRVWRPGVAILIHCAEYRFCSCTYGLLAWLFRCCTAWLAGAAAPGDVPAGGVAFTAVSPAVLPGIAGADELPLTEPPNVEGEVAVEPEFPVALAPPAALPVDVPEVVEVPAPPAAAPPPPPPA
jgi:hypothetical protein